MSHQLLERPVANQVEAFEPRPMKWSNTQYDALIAEGYFHERRVELIDGEILEMSPMAEPHALTLMRVHDWCYEVFSTREYGIRNQMSFFAGEGYRPEPDIAVVRRDILDGQSAPDSAVLIIEVSDKTLKYDRSTKAALYARAGIQDYWIFNVIDKSLEVRRDPRVDEASDGGFSYRFLQTFKMGSKVSPLLKPEGEIDLDEIFV